MTAGVSRRTLGIGIVLVFTSALACVRHDMILVDTVNRQLWALCAPVHSLIAAQASTVKNAWLDITQLRAVDLENKSLLSQVERLRVLQVRIERLEAENKRLSQLLEFGETRKDLRLLAAHVRRRSNSPYFRTVGFDIDAKNPSLTIGMPVISADGLVGQIRRLADGYAEVLLITDPRTAVDVVLEKSRVRGIAVGSGDPKKHTLTLKYLDRSSSVLDGERVLTTGDDGRFPSDLLVGVVQGKSVGAAMTMQGVRVRPASSLDDLRAVYVVLGTTGLSADGAQFIGGGK